MATRISKESLRKYFISVLDKEQVKKYVEGASLLKQNKFKPKMLRDYTPKMMYQRIPGGGILKKAAGVCKGCNDIRIADWILVDSVEAKATVRHEIAHALQHYKCGMNIRSHGKEFIEALKVVSPNNWRADRHYKETSEIIKARTKSFSNKKISLR